VRRELRLPLPHQNVTDRQPSTLNLLAGGNQPRLAWLDLQFFFCQLLRNDLGSLLFSSRTDANLR
jgi:hypothetical protein